MILDCTKRFCFIHIPRTAGVSITRALREACPESDVYYHFRRHVRATGIKRMLNEAGDTNWERMFRFAVIRSPFEIIASDYRLTLLQLRLTDRGLNNGWGKRLQRMHQEPGFGPFVRREILGRWSGIMSSGYWRTWCLGSQREDLGVEAIRYEKLKTEWPRICDRIGIRNVSLPWHNRSEEHTVQWTRNLVDLVAALCCDDIERFGYPLPEVG